MKRKIGILLFSLLFSLNMGVQDAHAQQLGILPKVPAGKNCNAIYKTQEVKNATQDLESFKAYISELEGDERIKRRDEILACAIVTGRSHLFMLPFYIMYIIEFLLGIAGLLTVLFVSYGGYKYVIGGLTQDKESGKKIIIQALMGLGLTLSAWIIVNLLQTFLTS